VNREFGIDLVWLLQGPGQAPVRHAFAIEADRLCAAFDLVEAQLRHFGRMREHESFWGIVVAAYPLMARPDEVRNLLRLAFAVVEETAAEDLNSIEAQA